MEQQMEEETAGVAGIPPVKASFSGRKKFLDNSSSKRARFDGCFSSFKEINVDSSIKSLKRLDSKKVKDEIKRWAKRVVSYARQLSDRYGNGSSHRR